MALQLKVIAETSNEETIPGILGTLPLKLRNWLTCAVELLAAFALDDGERGEAKGVEHVIDTANSQPIHQIPWQVPFVLRDKITKVVQEMLKG